MEVKTRTWQPLLYLSVIPLLGLIYTFINRQPEHVYSLYTDLDRFIPFMKVFIIPYAIWMPFLYLTLIYIQRKDHALYARTLVAYTISVILCYVIYMVFQTTVPRPAITESDWMSQLVMFVYRNDQPFNCFPSIHCLSSYLLFHAALSSPAIGNVPRWIIGIIAFTIIVSTVMVKQHVILDAIAGVAVAHVIFMIVSRIMLPQYAGKGVHLS